MKDIFEIEKRANGEVVLVKWHGKGTSVVVPEGVTVIGPYAFYERQSLEKVVFPESVTSIGASAFASCIRLSDVRFPDGLKSIGRDAFDETSKRLRLRVPASVKEPVETFWRLSCEVDEEEG